MSAVRDLAADTLLDPLPTFSRVLNAVQSLNVLCTVTADRLATDPNLTQRVEHPLEAVAAPPKLRSPWRSAVDGAVDASQR